jgi:hypothetical protein
MKTYTSRLTWLILIVGIAIALVTLVIAAPTSEPPINIDDEIPSEGSY